MYICTVTKYMHVHLKIPVVITQIVCNMVYVLSTEIYPVH